jgi:hypothetical protein
MADTATLNAGDDEPSLTPDEWRVLESYHRGGYIENWTQKDKVTLTNVLRKCYGESRHLPESFLAKVRQWIEKGS